MDKNKYSLHCCSYLTSPGTGGSRDLRCGTWTLDRDASATSTMLVGNIIQNTQGFRPALICPQGTNSFRRSLVQAWKNLPHPTRPINWPVEPRDVKKLVPFLNPQPVHFLLSYVEKHPENPVSAIRWLSTFIKDTIDDTSSSTSVCTITGSAATFLVEELLGPAEPSVVPISVRDLDVVVSNEILWKKLQVESETLKPRSSFALCLTPKSLQQANRYTDTTFMEALVGKVHANEDAKEQSEKPWEYRRPETYPHLVQFMKEGNPSGPFIHTGFRWSLSKVQDEVYVVLDHSGGPTILPDALASVQCRAVSVCPLLKHELDRKPRKKMLKLAWKCALNG